MPTARQALLDAAFRALGDAPWRTVRMVDVATLAYVSRQTLYNEFGTKGGLAAALLRRAADGYLAGVDRALTAPAPDRPAAVALWTVRAAREDALVRALLTGDWAEGLPRPDHRPGPRGGRAGGRRRPPRICSRWYGTGWRPCRPGPRPGAARSRYASRCPVWWSRSRATTPRTAARSASSGRRHGRMVQKGAGLSGPSRTAGGRSRR